MDSDDDLGRRLGAAAGPAPEAEPAWLALQERMGSPVPGPPSLGRRHRGRMLAVAAIVLAAVAAGTIAVTHDRQPSLHTTAPPPASGPVAFSMLQQRTTDRDRIGTLGAATDPVALATLWTEAGFALPAPSVDLTHRVVIRITVADDACLPLLSRFDRSGSSLEPHFVDPPAACERLGVARTYVVAVDWSATGDPFRLVLAGDRTASGEASRLVVRRPAPATPTSSTSAPTPPPTIAVGPETCAVVHRPTSGIEAVPAPGGRRPPGGSDHLARQPHARSATARRPARLSPRSGHLRRLRRLAGDQAGRAPRSPAPAGLRRRSAGVGHLLPAGGFVRPGAPSFRRARRRPRSIPTSPVPRPCRPPMPPRAGATA